MKSVKKVLQAAYDLLSDKRKWTQNAMARDAGDAQCNTEHPNAVKWCASGAVRYKAGSDIEVRLDALYALGDAANAMYSYNLVNANDILGYRQVRCVFRRAIKECKA